MEFVAGFGELDKTKDRHNHVGVGAWRAAERFFAEFFDFLFDNTSACYFVFASFFPTLLAFIFLLCYIIYGLK